jgi:hypothetical protein
MDKKHPPTTDTTVDTLLSVAELLAAARKAEAQRLAKSPAKIKLTTWGKPPAKPFTPPRAEDEEAPAQLRHPLPWGAQSAQEAMGTT